MLFCTSVEDQGTAEGIGLLLDTTVLCKISTVNQRRRCKSKFNLVHVHFMFWGERWRILHTFSFNACMLSWCGVVQPFGVHSVMAQLVKELLENWSCGSLVFTKWNSALWELFFCCYLVVSLSWYNQENLAKNVLAYQSLIVLSSI